MISAFIPIERMRIEFSCDVCSQNLQDCFWKQLLLVNFLKMKDLLTVFIGTKRKKTVIIEFYELSKINNYLDVGKEILLLLFLLF